MIVNLEETSGGRRYRRTTFVILLSVHLQGHAYLGLHTSQTEYGGCYHSQCVRTSYVYSWWRQCTTDLFTSHSDPINSTIETLK